jgi:hypothetical protein
MRLAEKLDWKGLRILSIESTNQMQQLIAGLLLVV